jgi:hypothetical protein
MRAWDGVAVHGLEGSKSAIPPVVQRGNVAENINVDGSVHTCEDLACGRYAILEAV